jgi:hypothetical protein
VSFLDSGVVTYSGVYEAVCLEVLTDRARVQVPQVFGTTVVTIFEFAGPRPDAGDTGWVSFEGGQAAHPIWVGSESKIGGSGDSPINAVWAAYKIDVIPISEANVVGSPPGTDDVVVLDPTETALLDGWIEVDATGAWGGNSSSSVNCRQGLYCPTYLAPDGLGWVSYGSMASPAASVWDSIGGARLNIPVGAGNGHSVFWRGNWSPSTQICSFRSSVTVKFYSLSSYPINAGPPGPPGPAGDSPQALAFHFVQATASTVWLITHNLNFQPNITAIDSAHSLITPGDIDYLSASVIRLTFSAAVAGEAYLS